MDIKANTLLISSALLNVPDHRRYGYQLMRDTGLGHSSMYTALHRMQNQGWLTSYLEPGDPKVLGRRRRRYYELTEDGERAFTDSFRFWASLLRGQVED